MLGIIAIIIAGFLGLLSLFSEQLTGEKKLNNDAVGTKTVFVKALLAAGIIIASIFSYFSFTDSLEEQEKQHESYAKLNSLYQSDLRNGRAIRNIENATGKIVNTLRLAQDTILYTQDKQVSSLQRISSLTQEMADPIPNKINVEVELTAPMEEDINHVLDSFMNDHDKYTIELIKELVPLKDSLPDKYYQLLPDFNFSIIFLKNKKQIAQYDAGYGGGEEAMSKNYNEEKFTGKAELIYLSGGNDFGFMCKGDLHLIPPVNSVRTLSDLFNSEMIWYFFSNYNIGYNIRLEKLNIRVGGKLIQCEIKENHRLKPKSIESLW